MFLTKELAAYNKVVIPGWGLQCPYQTERPPSERRGVPLCTASPRCLAAALGEDTSQRDTTAHQGKGGSANGRVERFGFGSWLILPFEGERFGREIFSSVPQCKYWVKADVKCRCGLFNRKLGEGRLQWQTPLGITSLAGPAWSRQELLVCHSQAVSEQKQLSHSGEPCPDVWHGRWERSCVLGGASCFWLQTQ